MMTGVITAENNESFQTVRGVLHIFTDTSAGLLDDYPANNLLLGMFVKYTFPNQIAVL